MTLIAVAGQPPESEGAPQKPPEFESDLGGYSEVYDGDVMILRGWPVLNKLGTQRWEELGGYGPLEYVPFGSKNYKKGLWYLVDWRLSFKEAVETYGKITHVERGPRGGFKSVTFGKHRMVYKALDPRKNGLDI